MEAAARLDNAHRGVRHDGTIDAASRANTTPDATPDVMPDAAPYYATAAASSRSLTPKSAIVRSLREMHRSQTLNARSMQVLSHVSSPPPVETAASPLTEHSRRLHTALDASRRRLYDASLADEDEQRRAQAAWAHRRWTALQQRLREARALAVGEPPPDAADGADLAVPSAASSPPIATTQPQLPPQLRDATAPTFVIHVTGLATRLAQGDWYVRATLLHASGMGGLLQPMPGDARGTPVGATAAAMAGRLVPSVVVRLVGRPRSGTGGTARSDVAIAADPITMNTSLAYAQYARAILMVELLPCTPRRGAAQAVDGAAPFGWAFTRLEPPQAASVASPRRVSLQLWEWRSRPSVLAGKTRVALGTIGGMRTIALAELSVPDQVGQWCAERRPLDGRIELAIAPPPLGVPLDPADPMRRTPSSPSLATSGAALACTPGPEDGGLSSAATSHGSDLDAPPSASPQRSLTALAAPPDAWQAMQWSRQEGQFCRPPDHALRAIALPGGFASAAALSQDGLWLATAHPSSARPALASRARVVAAVVPPAPRQRPYDLIITAALGTGPSLCLRHAHQAPIIHVLWLPFAPIDRAASATTTTTTTTTAAPAWWILTMSVDGVTHVWRIDRHLWTGIDHALAAWTRVAERPLLAVLADASTTPPPAADGATCAMETVLAEPIITHVFADPIYAAACSPHDDAVVLAVDRPSRSRQAATRHYRRATVALGSASGDLTLASILVRRQKASAKMVVSVLRVRPTEGAVRRAHDGPVMSVAWDGRPQGALMSGDASGEVRVWQRLGPAASSRHGGPDVPEDVDAMDAAGDAAAAAAAAANGGALNDLACTGILPIWTTPILAMSVHPVTRHVVLRTLGDQLATLDVGLMRATYADGAPVAWTRSESASLLPTSRHESGQRAAAMSMRDLLRPTVRASSPSSLAGPSAADADAEQLASPPWASICRRVTTAGVPRLQFSPCGQFVLATTVGVPGGVGSGVQILDGRLLRPLPHGRFTLAAPAPGVGGAASASAPPCHVLYHPFENVMLLIPGESARHVLDPPSASALRAVPAPTPSIAAMRIVCHQADLDAAASAAASAASVARPSDPRGARSRHRSPVRGETAGDEAARHAAIAERMRLRDQSAQRWDQVLEDALFSTRLQRRHHDLASLVELAAQSTADLVD
ncbi:hypothetical protein CXG81DRAFT_19582 [Caulochytrium protostelioides]|uniref:Uncharacterized protein n=1 Tax=Caulochytrium protostelioides TaxID=1555241 RepID=A0A4P9X653_9FUNG|nr:hypothetical protein CXG81DRAFT_19582 [Caulochytrium protostelioides]|eukprot:RKP00471.1 hypothetical protein CXG81DRAFT_19582 [Caulochytrium protostelioides]